MKFDGEMALSARPRERIATVSPSMCRETVMIPEALRVQFAARVGQSGKIGIEFPEVGKWV